MAGKKEITETNVGADLRVRPLEFHEARNLEEKHRAVGLKVKGKVMPFGGNWSYDKDADELTLTEAPTKDGSAGASSSLASGPASAGGGTTGSKKCRQTTRFNTPKATSKTDITTGRVRRFLRSRRSSSSVMFE